MSTLTRICAVTAIVLAASTAKAATPGPSTFPGTWRKLEAAPFAVEQNQTSVWTGRKLIVFGRNPTGHRSADVGETFDPATNTWRRLFPPRGPSYSPGYKSVWTGKEMLVFGPLHSVAFNPATKEWRRLPHALRDGILVWTGRKAVGWGGGCCGDALASGDAYNPTTRTYRSLPTAPLAASQQPLGAWTGRELIILVSGFDPDGKPYPARFARAAAYDPAANTWRRTTPLPVTGFRFTGSAVWDGREVLVVGAGATSTSAFAYNPRSNRWRRLASLPAAHVGATAVWTGERLLLWGGQTADALRDRRDGLSYDPRTNTWSSLPPAPMLARAEPLVTWTGHSMIVWGGVIGTPVGTRERPKFPRDGAAFTPAAP